MDIKESVIKAKQECLEIFSSELPTDIRLEEVILDDANNWVITLSYLRQPVQSKADEQLLIIEQQPSVSTQRIYKIFIIKKSNAEVISIKTRDLT